MAKYRNRLPQLADKLFLTDGGLETTLIFLDGIDLPYFASFDLLKTTKAAGTFGAITSDTSRWRRRPASALCWKA